MVPHRGTNWAALRLTAQIGRDAVLSKSYGRGWKYDHAKEYIPNYYKILSLLLSRNHPPARYQQVKLVTIQRISIFRCSEETEARP